MQDGYFLIGNSFLVPSLAMVGSPVHTNILPPLEMSQYFILECGLWSLDAMESQLCKN